MLSWELSLRCGVTLPIVAHWVRSVHPGLQAHRLILLSRSFERSQLVSPESSEVMELFHHPAGVPLLVWGIVGEREQEIEDIWPRFGNIYSGHDIICKTFKCVIFFV